MSKQKTTQSTKQATARRTSSKKVEAPKVSLVAQAVSQALSGDTKPSSISRFVEKTVVSGQVYYWVLQGAPIEPGLYIDTILKSSPENADWISKLIRIAGPFELVARGRGEANIEWGVWVCFLDPEGVEHTRLVLYSRLVGPDARKELAILAGMGLLIITGRKQLEALINYIQHARPMHERLITSVKRVGWYQGIVFVRPDQVFGLESSASLVCYNGEEIEGYDVAGTLADWQQNVARYCAGNSRFVLAVSMGFAAMLLKHAGMEGGGIHLHGVTSEGKTVALGVANSVNGSPALMCEWSTTHNAVETICVNRNDQLLVIDELGRLPDVKKAPYIVYTMANGSGKARMTVDGELRDLIRWNVLVLSGGEVDLESLERETGSTARGGAQIRIAAVPSNAGCGMGIVENLHDFIDPKSFVDRLLENARRYYGTPAVEFLRRLTEPEMLNEVKQELAQELDASVFALEVPADAPPEAARLARRFALIAFGGELATHFGITGWEPGEAVEAARRCFHAWFENKGASTAFDEREILRRIRHKLEAGLLARFVNFERPENWHRPSDLLGFVKYRKVDVGFDETEPADDDVLLSSDEALREIEEFWVLREHFASEFLKGAANDLETKRMLAQRGWLICDERGRYNCSVSIPQFGKARVFKFDAAVILNDEI